jgi:alginate O-acetyltransferase complex protein AlgI
MKNIILFLGSLVFYAWGEPVYIFLMLFSTCMDFMLGKLIGANRGRPAAKIFLATSVIINILVLGFFKYADFLIGTVNVIFGTGIPLLELGLPIGISFYTFQTMSYTIDVYRGEAKVQKNWLDFAVFVTMFPQLIAGPIVKYRQVEGSLHTRKLSVEAVSEGTKRFIIGLSKKVLIANNIGELWNYISSLDMNTISTLTAWLGIVAFAFQIYFDFSGYSDMAIGLGRILGFNFPENFNYPYISASVTEFWRRWHISLGSWFRDYVYIPLGGNRKGTGRQILNILIVWILTGIWHGAGYNFALWGLWFAIFLIIEKFLLKNVLEVMPKALGRICTILIVLIGWVFFSLDTPGQIFAYLKAMLGLGAGALADSRGLFLFGEYALLLIIAAVSSTPLVKMLIEKIKSYRNGYSLAICRLGEKIFIPALLILSIAFIVDASYNPFLYFRF